MATMVELPVKWRKEDAVDYSEFGIPGIEEDTEPGKMCVILDEIQRFNADKENTTIEMRNGTTFTILIEYEQFKKLFKLSNNG